MFTAEFLLQLHQQESSSLEELQAKIPVAIVAETAKEFREIAKECAVWMQRQGIIELRSVGPFMSFMPDILSTVTLKKFAQITINKRGETKFQIAQRETTVTVSGVTRGFIQKGQITHSKILWNDNKYSTEIYNVLNTAR